MRMSQVHKRDRSYSFRRPRSCRAPSAFHPRQGVRSNPRPTAADGPDRRGRWRRLFFLFGRASRWERGSREPRGAQQTRETQHTVSADVPEFGLACLSTLCTLFQRYRKFTPATAPTPRPAHLLHSLDFQRPRPPLATHTPTMPSPAASPTRVPVLLRLLALAALAAAAVSPNTPPTTNVGETCTISWVVDKAAVSPGTVGEWAKPGAASWAGAYTHPSRLPAERASRRGVTAGR